MPTWQTVLGILSPLGVIGAVLSIWTFLWHRKESRHATLAVILREHLGAVQDLAVANKARRRAEQLQVSFPAGSHGTGAAKRMDDFVARYNEHIRTAQEKCRAMEREFLATQSRFPDRVTLHLKKLVKSTYRLGEVVQSGNFDAADIVQASLADEFKVLTNVARGWRLTSPLESFRRKRLERELAKSEPPRNDRFEIPQDRMDLIGRLITKRATDQRFNSFAVHAPRVIIDRPDVIKGEKVVEELEKEQFKIVFQDGTTETLSLAEFVCFTYQLIFISVEMKELAEKLDRGGFGPVQVQISTELSIPDLMKPDMVRALLDKTDFSAVPSD